MQSKHRGRLLKLASFLEKLPPESFNIKNWVTKMPDENGCGTVACAIGWCPVVFPRSGIRYEKSRYSTSDIVRFQNRDLIPVFGAEDFFGLNYEEVVSLFFQMGYNKPNPLAQEVAAKIRDFVTSKRARLSRRPTC